MRGFMIAADRSGSGKTTVTRALMLLLKNAGCTVVPYKAGPDYIDQGEDQTAVCKGL